MAEEIIEVIYMKNEKWKEDNNEKDGYSIVEWGYLFCNHYLIKINEKIFLNKILSFESTFNIYLGFELSSSFLMSFRV